MCKSEVVAIRGASGALVFGALPNPRKRVFTFVLRACAYVQPFCFISLGKVIFPLFFLFYRFLYNFGFCALDLSFVDVPLILHCTANHVPDWERRTYLGIVEARSVDANNTHC